MARKVSPLDLWATGYEIWATSVEAQWVITMRMMGMANLWDVTPHESTRMLAEKPEAFGKAAMSASLAMMAGKRPDQTLKAATKQLRRKTRSNAKRLAKRGPKLAG